MNKQVARQVGQLFIVGLPGADLDDSTRRLIREFRINNFIYFKRNVADRSQLKRLSFALRQTCTENGLAQPLIAIDQEGGSVTRLPPPFTQFPDARVLANSPQPVDKLKEYARVCAQELAEVGMNMNLAPVLDVCEEGRDFFMERRCLGDDPRQVGELGGIIITEMQKQGIAACAKHFPGLGAAVVDPHLELPVVANSKDYLYAVDLPPFKMAIACGVSSIMTSHTIYRHLDPHVPATLSKRILTDLLRTQLGYKGLIMTDDLEMGAIENERSLDRAVLEAFSAGADLLLICHDHDKVIRAYRALLEAVTDGMISRDRLEASAKRLDVVRRLVRVH